MASYYPMFAQLTGRKVVVVGGGKVAERKLQGLLRTGANILVISPEATDLIKQWFAANQIDWKQADYEAKWLEGANLVFAATSDPDMNDCIAHDAGRMGQWVNRAEQPEYSDFIVPAALHRGKLSIAISTSGASPLTAKKIKSEIARMYGDEYELALDVLDELRQVVKQHVEDRTQRRQWFKQLAETDWLQVIRDGQLDKVKADVLIQISPTLEYRDEGNGWEARK